MEWYTVEKRIRGRVYLYRQRTAKQGNRVVTESQYLGPKSGSEGNTTKRRGGGAAKERPRVVAVDIDGVRQGLDVVKRARPRLANQLQALMVADTLGDVVVATGLRFMVRYTAGNNSWKVTLPRVANLLNKSGRQRLTDYTYGASAMLCLRLGRQHRPVLWARARETFGSRKEMRTALAVMMQKGHRRTERRITADFVKARGQRKAALTRLRKMGWLKRTFSKRGRQAQATLEVWKKREQKALRERRQFEALAPFLTCW